MNPLGLFVMTRLAFALAVIAAAGPQSPSPRAMFNAGDFRNCGIYYWLQDAKGGRHTVAGARAKGGKYSAHIRNNVAGGYLTIFEVGSGRELSPRDDKRWPGFRMSDAVFTVPGTFEFSDRDDASHLVIVWALSQTEVAGDAQHGLRRLVDMPRFMSIVTEDEDRTAGEIGTYVINRNNGGVPAEIRFRSK